ncbi:hypothetical protein JOD63_000117 [Microbacterium terrae]|uniref:DUF4386 family protein n=1 Tax=Microbacterium terrae TaxID=69369 RepID=A0A0M2GY85_9MICO|nr:hypothetical protein [Microbacterium terrae]KJL38730.1 hypothetical protein RS81_02525 [Microbacterium terrae]MBP1076149.1 hypothetical protein [Microbacterium terrae]
MTTSLRVAGWGTLGFALAFFVTFTLNALVNTLVPLAEHPLASDMADQHWGGVLFLSTWSSAGIALGVATIGLAAIVWPDGGQVARLSHLFGAIATAGWLLSGAASFAQRTTLLNDNIAAASADPAAENAVIEGLFVGVHTGGVLFAVAALPWLGIVAVGAAGHLPRTVVVLLWVAAVASFAGFVALGLQLGFLVVMLAFGTIGGILLIRARRAAEAPVEKAPMATPAAA